MSMTKKEFIALADLISKTNSDDYDGDASFTYAEQEALADFCASQNSRFQRKRWFDYIAGRCGPNGGIVK